MGRQIAVIIDKNFSQRSYSHKLPAKVTTIITTHYVDEARGANRVGFLRAGRLLAEDSPQVLDDSDNDMRQCQIRVRFESRGSQFFKTLGKCFLMTKYVPNITM